MIKHIKYYIKYILHTLSHKPISAAITIVEPQSILNEKVALVTGGTSGIGKAIASTFYKAGAYVVITGRNQEKTNLIASEICNGDNRVIGVKLDLCDVGKFNEIVNQLLEKVPNHKIDILVNNAGLVGGDIRSSKEDDFDNVISTNLKGTFFLSKVVADIMIKNRVEGNILNIASSSSKRPAISAYTLSKWGIRGLTEGLAKMLIKHKIVVNGVAPGPTATPMLGKNDYSDISQDNLPNGRLALPEEIASMALFLAGPQGRTIVGDIVYMTGGAGVIDNNDIDYTYNPQ